MNTMNKIRFKYPPFCMPYINLQKKEASILNVDFEEEEYLIDVEAVYYPSEYNHGKYIYIKEFRFEVEEGPERKGALSQLAENPDKYNELLSLLTSCINVLHRNIRNFGMTPDVNEIYPRYDAKEYITRWKVEIYTANGSWREIIPEPKKLEENLFLLLLSSSEESKNYPIKIESDKWEDIKFAIQSKREPPPELEFMTNAIEFLRINNLRLALLESITCLEIVLSQYLREYFKINKKIPAKRIDKFFKPLGIGLTARISVLLDLTLSSRDLSRINIDDILKAIEWRNEIIHKTGHLPEENVEEVKKKIWNILELADILALRRDQLKATPEMKQIADEFSEKYNMPIPKIWVLKNHHILIEFVFLSIDCFPKVSILKELIKAISDHLLKRDRLFDANKHLYINFIKSPREIVERWHQGKFELVQRK